MDIYLLMRLTIKIITPKINKTNKTPTQTPALKIPATTAQLENKTKSRKVISKYLSFIDYYLSN